MATIPQVAGTLPEIGEEPLESLARERGAILLQRLSDCYANACRISKHANLAGTYQMWLEPALP